MKVILKSKHNLHYAVGDYDGKGIKVLKGSKINPVDSYARMSIQVKSYRHNPDIISKDGELLQDVCFLSPTSAAIFVTGRSVNGFIAWRVEDEISLKEYRKQIQDSI